MGFLSLFRRSRTERTGFELYGQAVAAARDPFYYTALAVPDTLDGRFDMVGLHAWLLIRRLGRERPPGAELGQAIFDAMFSDMDVNLREMGVGDLSVGKRVRAMWEAFHGRAAAYEAAMNEPGAPRLSEALLRNVWRGQGDAGHAAVLAGHVRQIDAALAGQSFASFIAGRASFPQPSAGAIAP